MSRTCTLRAAYLLADAVAVFIATLLFNVVRYYHEGVSRSFDSLLHYALYGRALAISGALVLFWLGFFAITGYYNKPLHKSRLDDLLSTLLSVLAGCGIVFLIWVTNDFFDFPSNPIKLFLWQFGIFFATIYLFRCLITWPAWHALQRSDRWVRGLLIATEEYLGRQEELAEALHVHFVATIPIPPQADPGEIAQKVCQQYKAVPCERVYIFGNRAEPGVVGRLLYGLYPLRCSLFVSSESLLLPGAFRLPMALLKSPVVDVTATQMSEMGKNIKWLFDRIVALLVLLLFSPLYAVVALLVRRSGPGPIFYSQERIGLHGRPFLIYKFRTMYPDSESNGPQLSREDDPRITPIGRTLRKYRLDELPQMWNVLRGDMSLVGPRPERAHYIAQLIEQAPHYYLLHNVLPGITSLGMVRYGYASNLEEMRERLYYDWLYYQHMSLRLDIMILCYTIETLVKGRGK